VLNALSSKGKSIVMPLKTQSNITADLFQQFWWNVYFRCPMKVKADTHTQIFILQNTNCERLQKLEHVFKWQARKLNMHVFQALAMFPFPVTQLNYFLREFIQNILHRLLKWNQTTWLYFTILRKNITITNFTNKNTKMMMDYVRTKPCVHFK